jgi:hypothetical protein
MPSILNIKKKTEIAESLLLRFLFSGSEFIVENKYILFLFYITSDVILWSYSTGLVNGKDSVTLHDNHGRK